MTELTMRLRTILSAIALAAASAAGAQAVQLNVITKVQVQDAGKEVLVSITGSRPPNFTTFSMMDPPRFVVDVSESTFKNVPADITGGSTLIQVVKNVSYGSEATSIARVMIAFTREVDPPDVQTAGNDLVVRIAKPPEMQVAQQAAPAPPVVAQGTPEAKPAAPAPPVVAQATPEAKPAAPEPTVVAQATPEVKPAAPEPPVVAQATPEAKPAAPADAAAEQARLEAEEQARWEAKARADAEARAKAEQEEALAQSQAKQQQDRAGDEAKARAEAEARAQAEQEARARTEALAQAQAQAQAKQEQDRSGEAAKARAEAEAQARVEAKARAEDERRLAREEEKTRREAAALKVASVPPSEPRRETLAPGAPNQVREIGFRQMAGASRVFVRTAQEPRFTITEAGENVIRVELANTRVRRHNDARFMDTSFFASAVAMVTPMRAGSAYVVEIKLKERVPYQQKVEGDVLSIDFERPASLAAPSGQAAPGEPAASEPPPGPAPAGGPAPGEPQPPGGN